MKSLSAVSARVSVIAPKTPAKASPMRLSDSLILEAFFDTPSRLPPMSRAARPAASEVDFRERTAPSMPLRNWAVSA